MLNSKMIFESLLQKLRFKRTIPYLNGDVLDFGGNEGELKPFVKGNYLLVNYNHFELEKYNYDTIVSLAVIEHIEYNDVVNIFHKFKKVLRSKGKIILTTPSRQSKPILEFLAELHILDKKNIEEHKYYFNKNDLLKLAKLTGFKIKEYKTFQFGLNQFVIMEHND